MTGFALAFNRLSPLIGPAVADLEACLKVKDFAKGSFILKRSEICSKLYFLDSGLVKTSFFKEDREFIMRFFQENSFFSVLDSFTARTPSHFNIIALEATAVTYISQTDLESLSRKHHCIETAFRRLLAFATTMLMKRVSEILEENATEGYHRFLDENRAIFNRISLGDISNYLGISQVSLSRIRGKA